MEPFGLPTLTGLHLIPGLCDGVLEALDWFPSLQTLPHTATLGHHGVNVHGTESRNKSMVVLIENPYEGIKTEEVAKRRGEGGRRVAVCYVGLVVSG
jgi:5'-3' exoribonuclease 1